MSQTVIPSPKLATFLAALPHADPQAFVSPPGLGGTWRSRYILSALEKGVLAVHWSGAGLCIMQPSSHGVCKECAGRKGSDCTHCACSMCVWFRQTEERASPRVGRERLQQLMRRLKTFQFGSDRPVGVAALDDDIL